jgi:hypothetical protein
MKVYLKRKNGDVEATGIFNESTRSLTVLKGSRVSSQVHHTEKFRGAKTIEVLREKHVINGVVKEDVIFKSASTAANFVTGSSTNGLTSWKTEEGKRLGDIIKELTPILDK